VTSAPVAQERDVCGSVERDHGLRPAVEGRARSPASKTAALQPALPPTAQRSLTADSEAPVAPVWNHRAMAEEDFAIVRRLLEGFNRGANLAELEELDDDIEYVNPSDAMEPGTRHGRAEFQRVLSMLFDSFDDLHIEVERVLDAGPGRVLVLAQFQVRGRGSGVRMDQPQSYLCTLRDGRAVRVEWFWGHEAGLAAAGLDV
jgi:ketosteroid isomerase-like protein